jgi:hypothetical protein
MGRQLHSDMFAHKRMTPLQIELWMTERQFEYRIFGLAASLLEAVPLAGLAFSISNRVGAAMYAHDLEKVRRCRIMKLRSELLLTSSFLPAAPAVIPQRRTQAIAARPDVQSRRPAAAKQSDIVAARQAAVRASGRRR